MDFKKLRINLCAGCLLLSGQLLMAQTDSAAGVLHIVAPVQGLAIYIDGRYAGQSPLLGYSIPSGETEILVSAPDSLNWLAVPWTSKVMIQPLRAQLLHARFPSKLWISTQPPGARVLAGDSLLGYAPLAVDKHTGTVHLVKPGFEEVFILLKGHDQSIHTKMVPLASLGGQFAMRHPRMNRKRLLWGGLVSLALGGAGYYLRTRADAEYEAYMATGHQGRMDTHFKNAQNFDRWSGALYLAGEASLGLTLYFSLKDLWR